MNILVISQMYSQPDDVGDNRPTKTVNYFVREWVKMKHNVVVLHCPSKFPILFYLLPDYVKKLYANRISTMVPSIDSIKEMEREECGALVYRLPMFKIFPGASYSKKAFRKQARKIEEKLEKIDFTPEVILGHFANPSLELTAILAEYYGAKSSIVFHHDCGEKNIKKYRIKNNINKIHAIGARSIIEARQIQKKLNLARLPFICCSGVPDEAVEHAEKCCKKQDLSKGSRYIYVGSLIRRKHADVVIKAFAGVAQENDVLEIIGGGPEEEKLKQLVSKLHLEKKVIFIGRVPRREVLQYMKNAQIFTLISSGETFGMVYIEAMLYGCLVIASRGGGFDGIIKDGENGFICEAGNQAMLEKIYHKINAMTMNERNEIGQRAIDTAVQFSEHEVAKRYLNDVLERN